MFAKNDVLMNNNGTLVGTKRKKSKKFNYVERLMGHIIQNLTINISAHNLFPFSFFFCILSGCRFYLATINFLLFFLYRYSKSNNSEDISI